MSGMQALTDTVIGAVNPFYQGSMGVMGYVPPELEQQGVTYEDFRAARRAHPQLFFRNDPNRKENIYETAQLNRTKRDFQNQFDQANSAHISGQSGAFEAMQDVYNRATQYGIQLNTRGIQGLDSVNQSGSTSALSENQFSPTNNSGSTAANTVAASASAGNQANNLLNAHAGIDQIVQDQAAAASNMGITSGLENPYGMANQVDVAGLQEEAAINKMGMQNEQFMSDLAYTNAIRARPISRDISHQANDAMLANTRAQTRAQVANGLLNAMATAGGNWASFYKMS